jgi:transcriptional regulator with XRE-family HTH domain
MHEKEWWQEYGSFQRWKWCPSRPDPIEVLLCYLAKRGIGPERHVPYLMDLLGLQKSMVYMLLKGEALDTISRCRKLVQALQIPPPLLGLDAVYAPIEQYAYWWRTYDFPFNADEQGYPVTSEIVTYLRKNMTKTDDDGKVEVWTQEDLGDACGLRKETIYRTEHEKNPLVLESMSRRAALASALGHLPGMEEAVIFRLFGLDPQAYRVPVTDQTSVPAVRLSTRGLPDEMLQARHTKLAAFFMNYATGHAQDDIGEVLEGIREAQVEERRACTTGQRVGLLAIQSRSHRLLAHVAREQCQKSRILLHANSAVKYAERAMTLLNPKLESDQADVLTTNELLASALFTSALSYFDLGNYDLAQEAITRAVSVLPTVQSVQLKTEVLGAAALIGASLAPSLRDQRTVLSYLHCAVQLHMASQFPDDALDDNFFWYGKGMLCIYKARVFRFPHMNCFGSESVMDLLADAQRLTPPSLIRRQTMIEVCQAQALEAEGKYRQATEVALSALEKCRLIRSRLWRNALEGVYQQLLNTSYRDKPPLVYFGVRLRMWDYGTV